jgi:hypothetical protein
VIDLRLSATFALLLGFAASMPALADGSGIFNRKSRMDPARVRQLIAIVKSEPDEKKRKISVAELAGADPRVHIEVIPALIGALRKDAAASVRAGAAEVIGTYNVLYSTAGVALEEALEADASAEVRGAARQALWEYHLLGYKSARGADGLAGQTAEPPLARSVQPAAVLTAEPPTAAPPRAIGVGMPTIAPLPPVGEPPGPRIVPQLPRPALPTSPAPPHPNLTVEPPLARPKSPEVTIPPGTSEPPYRTRILEPVVVGKPPPIALDLPPIVPPPETAPARQPVPIPLPLPPPPATPGR